MLSVLCPEIFIRIDWSIPDFPGDVEKILRREGLPLPETLDPCNYLIAHGLHE